METYIAYFDETGDDGITTKSSSEFVLSSIYMPSEKWQENFDKFKSFRKELRKWTGLQHDEEMHTMHFIRDRDPYRNFNWSLKQKQEILINYSQAISSLNLKAVNVIIDKTHIKTQNYPILERALTYNIQRIEEDSNGNWKYLVISDNGKILPMQIIARKIRSKKLIQSNLDYSLDKPIQNLIEDILEKDSRESYFIQISDFISCFVYLFYRHVLKKESLPKRINNMVDEAFIIKILEIFKENEILKMSAGDGNEYGLAIYPRCLE